MSAAIRLISSNIVYCWGAVAGMKDLLLAKVTDRDTRLIKKIMVKNTPFHN